MARDFFERIEGEARPLDELLPALAEAHGLGEVMRAHRLVIEWHHLVGETISRVTVPDGLHKGVLSVWVKTSPWMQELRAMKSRVIGDINRGLGDPPLVTDLRLHYGGARILSPDDPVAALRRWMEQRKRPPPKPETPAGPVRAEQIAREAAKVEDDELRSLIQSVRTRWDR
ncbi:MAG TPA: DciA family protein [Kofleriaceae bacterium]|nr:DciA family protein [Kofleriaceae bacterium]